MLQSSTSREVSSRKLDLACSWRGKKWKLLRNLQDNWEKQKKYTIKREYLFHLKALSNFINLKNIVSF